MKVLCVKISCLGELPCTRCGEVMPVGADYFRFDQGERPQRVCLRCFNTLTGKDDSDV